VLFFEAMATPTSEVTFAVHALIERQKRFSPIPPDPLEREVSLPAAMSTRAYLPGFIYWHAVVLRQRTGSNASRVCSSRRTDRRRRSASTASSKRLYSR